MSTKTNKTPENKAASEQQRNEAYMRLSRIVDTAAVNTPEYQLTIKEQQKLTKRIEAIEETIKPLQALRGELSKKLNIIVADTREKYRTEINNIIYRAKMENISLAELFKLVEEFKAE
jgi:hypothetical protein